MAGSTWHRTDPLPGAKRVGAMIHATGGRTGPANLIVSAQRHHSQTGGPTSALEGVKVEIQKNGSPLAMGQTTATSECRADKLPIGDVTVRAEAPGFGPAPASGQPVQQGPVTATLTLAKGDNTCLVEMMQLQPRAIITVVEFGASGAPLMGAEVQVGGLPAAITDGQGRVITAPFPLGTHVVTVKKRGYRCPNNGPDTFSKSFTFNFAFDHEATVEMENAIGVVWSSEVTVGGKPFVEWFNTVLRPRYPGKLGAKPSFPGADPKVKFEATVSKAGFTHVFDNCAKWSKAELTINEFIACFAVMYNETSGQLSSQIEPAGYGEDDSRLADRLKYCFEPMKTATVNKGSYNHASGNVPAGTRLEKITSLHLTPEQVKAWNGSSPLPPDEPDGTYREAAKCDFHKFRGRGLFQLTGRPAYRICAAELAGKFAGLPSPGPNDATLEALTDKQLNDAFKNDDVVFGSVRKYWNMRGADASAVNGGNWSPFGTAVSGSKAYGDGLYTKRCQTLLDEMMKDGITLKPRPATP